MNIQFIKYGSLLDTGTSARTFAGKFVQMRNGDTEYLIFSPKEISSYHADIVERFCRERKIPGAYNGRGKTFVIHDPEWVVVGGGKFEINPAGKYIRLYDNSMAYGRFDSRGLEEEMSRVKEFAEYKIIID